jgi:hypothetical protein
LHGAEESWVSNPRPDFTRSLRMIQSERTGSWYTHFIYKIHFVNLDSNVLKIENRIGVVAHACNPSLFMRLRSGGLRFEANQKRKKKKVSKIPISTNRFL